jgi:hypothetical protein
LIGVHPDCPSGVYKPAPDLPPAPIEGHSLPCEKHECPPDGSNCPLHGVLKEQRPRFVLREELETRVVRINQKV